MSESKKRPLGITDRRKLRRAHSKAQDSSREGQGEAKPLAGLFNDRRKNNGTGSRAK